MQCRVKIRVACLRFRVRVEKFRVHSLGAPARFRVQGSGLRV